MGNNNNPFSARRERGCRAVYIMNMDILDKIGIKILNPMQVAVGKEITSSQKDVVILSPTGTGKTLAYMLPLQEQLDRDDINVQMLVIVPGRELALQSHEVLKEVLR